MSIFTRTNLKAVISTRRQQKEIAVAKYGDSYTKTVFLSHSHVDADLIKWAAELLSSDMVSVYVDVLDRNLPEEISSATADYLRGKIRICDRFVVLATENSTMKSRWVPWELGFADGVKNFDEIALLPVSETDTNWNGSEYLNLYQSIQFGNVSFSDLYSPRNDSSRRLFWW